MAFEKYKNTSEICLAYTYDRYRDKRKYRKKENIMIRENAVTKGSTVKSK